MNNSNFYLWLSISSGCVNKGNLLIETALRSMVELRGKKRTVSAFFARDLKSEKLLHNAEFIVLPGATLLEPSDNPFLSSTNTKQFKVFAPGVAFNTISKKPNISIIKNFSTPVGSRDPYSHEAIIHAGGSSLLVGCPTLFLNKATDWVTKDGPIVVSLGKGPQDILLECIQVVAAYYKVIILNHVPSLQYVSIPGTVTKSLYDSTLGIKLYSSASLVVTSRLHALLPCIAFGTPFIFIGGWKDSRYSLLEYLNISTTPPEPELVLKAMDSSLKGNRPSSFCLERADSLRKSMLKYIDVMSEIFDGAIYLRRDL